VTAHTTTLPLVDVTYLLRPVLVLLGTGDPLPTYTDGRAHVHTDGRFLHGLYRHFWNGLELGTVNGRLLFGQPLSPFHGHNTLPLLPFGTHTHTFTDLLTTFWLLTYPKLFGGLYTLHRTWPVLLLHHRDTFTGLFLGEKNLPP